MVEHVVCKYGRKKILEKIRDTHRLGSIDEALIKLIGLYEREYRSEKDILIEELGKINQKYHYLFSPIERELYCLFIALIRGSKECRIGIAETILRNVKQDHQLTSQGDKCDNIQPTESKKNGEGTGAQT